MQGKIRYDDWMDAIELTKQAIARIRSRLDELGWTQTQLAVAIGVKPPHMSRVLKGERPAELETVVRIADVLDVSPEELLAMLLPLKGVVCAGDGADEEYPPGTTLPVHSLYPFGTVAYLVQGHSMEDALIGDGDYVLVRPQPVAQSGEIVVVWVPDMGTVVKLKRKKHYAGANERQPRDPIPMDGCKEYGVLVGVIRKC